MRFLSLYKTAERDVPPTQEEMAKLGKMVEDGMTAGFLLGVEGCLPSVLGARVRRSGEKVTVTDGPFTESKEVVGGFAILKANSKEEAIELVKNFLQAAGEESANFAKYSRRTRIHKRRGLQDRSGGKPLGSRPSLAPAN